MNAQQFGGFPNSEDGEEIVIKLYAAMLCIPQVLTAQLDLLQLLTKLCVGVHDIPQGEHNSHSNPFFSQIIMFLFFVQYQCVFNQVLEQHSIGR